MRAMFTMMNEARIGVGLQGYAQAEAAYQNALAYARDRLQGRAVPKPPNPDAPADPLIVHPDIRRGADGPEELRRRRPRADLLGAPR